MKSVRRCCTLNAPHLQKCTRSTHQSQHWHNTQLPTTLSANTGTIHYFPHHPPLFFCISLWRGYAMVYFGSQKTTLGNHSLLLPWRSGESGHHAWQEEPLTTILQAPVLLRVSLYNLSSLEPNMETRLIFNLEQFSNHVPQHAAKISQCTSITIPTPNLHLYFGDF